MRRHRYEDYYAQAEIKLQKAEIGPDDIPIFTENALHSIQNFEKELITFAKLNTQSDTPKARINKRNIELGDLLRDSRSSPSPAAAKKYLEINRDLEISL